MTYNFHLFLENVSVLLTKGSKTKPGLINLSRKHDIRLGKNIAFDLDSEVGSRLNTYFDNNIPLAVINIV